MTRARLQERSFLVLTALAAGPQHGYGVLKDVEALSGGAVVLRVGTLYGALDRLSGEALSSWPTRRSSTRGCVATTG